VSYFSALAGRRHSVAVVAVTHLAPVYVMCHELTIRTPQFTYANKLIRLEFPLADMPHCKTQRVLTTTRKCSLWWSNYANATGNRTPVETSRRLEWLSGCKYKTNV